MVAHEEHVRRRAETKGGPERTERKLRQHASGPAATTLRPPTAFPAQLLEILSDPTSAGVVEWLPHGHAFAITELETFTKDIMPTFTRGKLTSFQRQLNLYGFRKLTRGADATAGALVYFHPAFKRGRPEMMRAIVRIACKGALTLNRLRNEDAPYNPRVPSEAVTEVELDVLRLPEQGSGKRPRDWRGDGEAGKKRAASDAEMRRRPEGEAPSRAMGQPVCGAEGSELLDAFQPDLLLRGVSDASLVETPRDPSQGARDRRTSNPAVPSGWMRHDPRVPSKELDATSLCRTRTPASQTGISSLSTLSRVAGIRAPRRGNAVSVAPDVADGTIEAVLSMWSAESAMPAPKEKAGLPCGASPMAFHEATSVESHLDDEGRQDPASSATSPCADDSTCSDSAGSFFGSGPASAADAHCASDKVQAASVALAWDDWLLDDDSAGAFDYPTFFD